jgi:hypothetical protein
VSWAILGMLVFHGLSVITMYSVLNKKCTCCFVCSWASLAACAVSAVSHSMLGESGRMIPPLQAVYTAWTLGPAYTPSSL